MIGDVEANEHDVHDYFTYMKNLEFNRAMDEIWVAVRSHNQYIERIKPWEIAKAIAKTDRRRRGALVRGFEPLSWWNYTSR